MDENETSMWGGRFAGESDPLFRAFNDSLPFDHVLAEYDITGSIGWADAIRDAGVLTEEECAHIAAALESLLALVRERGHDLFSSARDEDIHSWVERQLIERIGNLGKKLHTGRSRNDQVATDLRMYARDAIRARQSELRGLQKTLIDVASREIDTVMPGYTHLQRGQPILFAHWCLAYIEMFERDHARFDDAFRRTNVCPLGCGALAGTGLAIDRHALAAALGFDEICRNSLDAVSDRDFVLEILFCASGTTLHLSRLAEDSILYASGEFGFIEMSDAVTSGSSLMPQKKNPDAMELIRGKTGRVFAELAAMAMTIKATPLAYNKDFQEDKVPLFTAMHELSMCLRMADRVMRDVKANQNTMRNAARGGHTNATALADYLVEKGVPFREAHERAGRIVRIALERNCAIEELPLDVLRVTAPQIERDVFDRITIDSILARCDAMGGTSPQRVREAIEAARKMCSSGMPAQPSPSPPSPISA